MAEPTNLSGVMPERGSSMLVETFVVDTIEETRFVVEELRGMRAGFRHGLQLLELGIDRRVVYRGYLSTVKPFNVRVHYRDFGDAGALADLRPLTPPCLAL